MLGNLLKCRASQYAQVPYTICREDGMSGKALGYYTKLQSLPDDFEFSVEGFSRLVKDGTSAVRSGFMELEEFGYLVRARRRLPSGIFNSETIFITLDEPGLSGELREFLESYDYHIISKTPERQTPGVHLDLKSLAPRFKWEHEGYVERKAQQEERIRAKQINMGLAKDGVQTGSRGPDIDGGVTSPKPDSGREIPCAPVIGSGFGAMEAASGPAANNAIAAEATGSAASGGKTVVVADSGERVRRSQPECENRNQVMTGEVWKTKNEASGPEMWKTEDANSGEPQNRRSEPECENRILAVSGQDSDIEADAGKSSQVATRMRKSTCGKSKTILNTLDTTSTIPSVVTLTIPGVRADGHAGAGAQMLDVLDVNPDGLTPTLPEGSAKPEGAPAFSEGTVLSVADRLSSEGLAPSSAALRYASSEPIPATDQKAVSSAATSLATALHAECGLAFEDEAYNEILFNLTSILTSGAAPLDVLMAFKVDQEAHENTFGARDLAKWTLDAWLEFKAGRWRHSDVSDFREALRAEAESVIADSLADVAAGQAGEKGVPERVSEKLPDWASALLPQYAHGIVWSKEGPVDVVHGMQLRVADLGADVAAAGGKAASSEPGAEKWRIAMEAAIAETAASS